MQKTATIQSGFTYVKALNTQTRIGSTVYEVAVYLNENATQTVEEKLLRLVKNDLILAPKNGTIEIPQTGQLLERFTS